MDLDDGLDMDELLARARRVQQDMTRAHEELRAAHVQGTAGGGAVRAAVDGRGELQELVISSAVADPGNAQGLADLIVSAVRDAQRALVAQNEERLRPVLKALKTELGGFAG
ncbi:YbaB/EbfC family nucleoid-associated protein [Streptomyces sp. NBC_00433]